MPTYEYACAACQHEFEAFQSMKDPALTKCPSCGEDKARRQISRGTGFILKGGGWYSDLYASSPSGGKKPSSDGGGGSSGTSEGSSSSGSSSSGGTSGGTAGGSSGGDSGAAKPAST